MAAIDITGRTIVVTAAATLGYDNVKIVACTVWCATTAADFQVTELGTGAIQVIRISPDRSQIAPFSISPLWQGDFGRLSFDTVSACTAYLQMG